MTTTSGNKQQQAALHGADDAVDVNEIDDAMPAADVSRRDEIDGSGNEGQPDSAAPLRRRYDSDRERLYKRARELRQAEDNPTADSADDPAAEEAVDDTATDIGDDRPASDQNKDQGGDKAPVLTDDAEIELVVYGVPIKKKLSEIKADAQKLLAADAKFEEAKRAAAEARDLLKEAQAQRGNSSEEHHQDDSDRKGTKKTTSVDPADQPEDEVDDVNVDSIAHRLQVGDLEEGKEAIAELVKLVRGRKTSAVDEDQVSRVVEERLERTRTKQEIDTAVANFSQAFPNIVKDDELVDVALRRVSKELRADLLAAGLSEDELGKITDPGDLVRFHSQMRRSKGTATLRSYDDVLTSVGKHLTTKFGALLGDKPAATQKPAQQTPTADKMAQRVEAKRAAPQQPRASGVRTESSAPAPKTHAQILAEIRNSRPAFRRR